MTILTLVLFATAGLLSAPIPADGQRMTEEVAALHRAAFELVRDDTLGDARVYRELALRYLEGRGVERDVIQGCA